MTNFEEVLNGAEVSEAERAQLVREWLKKEYNLKLKNDDVISTLLVVHSAESPAHFAHPVIETTYGEAVFQIVFTTGNWHLSYRKEPLTEFTLLHPRSEGASWSNLKNRTAVAEAGQILKNGVVGLNETPQAAVNPGVVINGGRMSVNIPEEVQQDDVLKSNSVDILGGFAGTDFGGSSGISSISIDLSSYEESTDK